MIRDMILAGLAGLHVAMSASADMIQLKAGARLEAGASQITVADVAEIHGAHAETYRDVVVLPIDPQQNEAVVTVDDVRKALDAAGAHWGRLELNGRRTHLRRASSLAAAPQAMTSANVAQDSVESREGGAKSTWQVIASSGIDEGNIASLICARAVEDLKLPASQIRLTFDSREKDFLEQPAGEHIAVAMDASAASERVRFQIRIERANEAETRDIAARLEIRSSVILAATMLSRGQTLNPQMVSMKDAWISAREREQRMTGDPTGWIVRHDIAAHEIIHKDDLFREEVIARGDVVPVRCLVGGITITMQAEARADGAPGDMIEFRKLGERDAFLARVLPSGEAEMEISRRGNISN